MSYLKFGCVRPNNGLLSLTVAPVRENHSRMIRKEEHQRHLGIWENNVSILSFKCFSKVSNLWIRVRVLNLYIRVLLLVVVITGGDSTTFDQLFTSPPSFFLVCLEGRLWEAWKSICHSNYCQTDFWTELQRDVVQSYVYVLHSLDLASVALISGLAASWQIPYTFL